MRFDDICTTEKREKHSWKSVTFSNFVRFNFHGHFSLNCKNSTKSRKGFHTVCLLKANDIPFVLSAYDFIGGFYFILCVQIALCQNRYTVVEIDLRHPCPPKLRESVLNNYKHTEIVFFRIQ